MKNRKKILSLVLAVSLCLCLAACGAGAEETTEPTQVQAGSDIWTSPALEGVIHSGEYILAESATDDQVLAAAVLLADGGTPVEGYTYMREFVLYYPMTDQNGDMYYPASVYLPDDGTRQGIYYNGYNGIRSQFGNVDLMVLITTNRLSDELLAALPALEGWENLSEQQLHVVYAFNEVLAEYGLTYGAEGVGCNLAENGLLGMWQVETERGVENVIAYFYVMGQDADGEYAISQIRIMGTIAESYDEDYSMTEQDIAVFEEIMTRYNLYAWMEME